MSRGKFDCVSESVETLKKGWRGEGGAQAPPLENVVWNGNQDIYFKTTTGTSNHVDKNRTGLTQLRYIRAVFKYWTTGSTGL